jgi:hypothetical protein
LSAQEQPSQDSQLTTPQPDQPAPSEAERQTSDAAEETAPPVQDQGADESQAAPASRFPTNEEQEAAQAQREQELRDDADEHRQRTEHSGDRASREQAEQAAAERDEQAQESNDSEQ